MVSTGVRGGFHNAAMVSMGGASQRCHGEHGEAGQGRGASQCRIMSTGGAGGQGRGASQRRIVSMGVGRLPVVCCLMSARQFVNSSCCVEARCSGLALLPVGLWPPPGL